MELTSKELDRTQSTLALIGTEHQSVKGHHFLTAARPSAKRTDVSHEVGDGPLAHTLLIKSTS